MTRKSRIVGDVRLPNGGVYQCFEALVVLDCWQCGNEISKGDHFARLVRPGGGRARHDICTTCEPHEAVAA